MNSKSQPRNSDKKDLSFDLDGDGVPDIYVEDTNGHTVYVNIRWLLLTGVATLSSVAAFLGIVLW